MKDYLKKYEVIIKTKGPVFVGDGKEIGKKEYVFLSDKSVGVFDIEKLYAELKRRNRAAAFEKYMLENNRDNMNEWLAGQKINIADIRNTIKYELKSCDYINRRAKGLQVMSFIKDAYGKPYIPGSSLKGMLRTILLAMDIMDNKGKYLQSAESIDNVLDPRNTARINRTQLLKKEAGDLETIAFRTLTRNENKPGDAVNDIMQGFIVSDSLPLSINDLALCQRIEVHKDGEEKSLPLLRESIKPGTEIKFMLTIDSSVCRYIGEDIIKGVKAFAQQYYDNFLVKFNKDRLSDNTVFLGGGPGFLSKTIIYPLFGEAGVGTTVNIFYKTGVGDKHKDDRRIKLSPHILKCTHYDGKLYQFGECELILNRL